MLTARVLEKTRSYSRNTATAAYSKKATPHSTAIKKTRKGYLHYLYHYSPETIKSTPKPSELTLIYGLTRDQYLAVSKISQNTSTKFVAEAGISMLTAAVVVVS